VIHTQPSPTATAGRAFGTQPVIFVEDQSGNLETGDNSTNVTVKLKTGTGPLDGKTTVTVANGIAKFAGLADKKAETIVLDFTSGTLAQLTSNKTAISSSSGPAQVVRGLATVNDTTKETVPAKNGPTIRCAKLKKTGVSSFLVRKISHQILSQRRIQKNSSSVS
jgi:hypothetical protein